MFIFQSRSTWKLKNHVCNSTRRHLIVSSQWEPELTHETLEKVESHWLNHLRQKNEKLECVKDDREKFYILSMFPYPSGRLHMGHVRVYTISDTIAHYHRMNGKQVLHPMGWDAFGLPAENAAIERGLRPEDWTQSNISYMRKQLQDLATTFNWEREVTTCSPEYYRWTQLIFLRMFKSGLAYQKEAMVNWDPVDQTVLANEQVDEDGCSWRSGARVEQRLLKQWFLKMTHFSKALQDGLRDLPEWPSGIKSSQESWIGDCSGAIFDFRLKVDHPRIDPVLTVHASSPELIFGATHIVLSPSHTLLKNDAFLGLLDPGVRERLQGLETESCDVNLGLSAENPLSGQSVPLFASSILPFEENVTVHLAIPAASVEDSAFAERHGLPLVEVLEQGSGSNPDNPGTVVNSGKFTGMSREEAKGAILDYARIRNIGGHLTSPRQYDWLISRQRYWGTPIPVIHCPKCKAVPVPEDQLPVVLPKLDSLAGKGLSPLTKVTEWYNVNCPQCSAPSVRETDTMDTFVDSAWYFLRYTDAANGREAFSKERADWLMPVDLYIGGKEHAILHLLYARFITHFLHQQGMVASKEPFKRLLVQGLVTGQSYRDVSSGRYLTKEEVDFSGPQPFSRSTGEPVEVKWEKMSKSKYNGVDPEDSIAEYGVDTVRLFILSGIPPEHNMPWNVDAIPGVIRWKRRVWALVTRFREIRSGGGAPANPGGRASEEAKLRKQLNYTIKEVSKQYEEDHMLSVAISRLMTFTNFLKGRSDSLVAFSPLYERALCALCTMMAPMAPLMASEMWRGIAELDGHLNSMHWDKDVLDQEWPCSVEEEKTQTSDVALTVKINNATVGTVQIPTELITDEERLKEFLLQQSSIGENLSGQKIKRTIIAPKVPLVNFLVDS